MGDTTTAFARQLRKKPTWAAKLMWRWLRDRRFSGYKFRREHLFGKYCQDFFCEEARSRLNWTVSSTGIRRDALTTRNVPGLRKPSELRNCVSGTRISRFACLHSSGCCCDWEKS